MPAEPDLFLVTAPARPLFHTLEGAISGRELLSYAHGLAEHLPDRPVINLHTSPLHFTIVFLASLLKGQYCLLSSNHATSRLLALQNEHDAVCTGPSPLAGVESFLLPPLAELASSRQDNPQLPAGYRAACVFTSGSTDAARMHVKCWGELVARSHAALPLLGPAGTTLLGTVPPYHMYGFETLILQSLHTPTATASGPCFFPRDIEKLLASTPAPHTLITTPVHLRSLTSARASLPGLGRIISASAPLPMELAHEAEKRFNAPVMEIYGATETGSIASRRTTSPAPWALYEGITLTPDLTEPPGEGHIFNAPHATSHPLNDIITMEGPRHFHLAGRKGDMLKIAGKRTSYGALNKILLQTENVLDGCFAPLHTGQELQDGKTEPSRLQAFIVSESDDAASILQALRHHIEPAFLPRRLVRLKALPRNPVGKLTRQALEALVHDYTEKRCHPPFAIPASHPALPGHFPGNPTIPGVALLEAAFSRMKLDVRHVESVKFLSIVRPDEPMQLRSSALGISASGAERVRFSLHHMDGRRDGAVILRGTVQGQQI